MIIIKIIFHVIFLLIVFKDMRYKIIPEYLLILLLFISIIKLIIIQNFSEFYYSISIYTLPFYLIVISETYLNKELIGLGDLKLMLVVSSYISNSSLIILNIYYLITYLLSFIYIIIKKPKDKYIAFAPYMYLSFLVLEYYYL